MQRRYTFLVYSLLFQKCLVDVKVEVKNETTQHNSSKNSNDIGHVMY